MSAFNEILNSLGEAVDGSYTVPDTIVADLMGAYDSDIAMGTESSAALEAQISALSLENATLKELNAIMLQNVAATEGNEVEEPEDDPTDISIDDLFENEE